MNTALFVACLLIGACAPVLAITYIRPILVRILRSLCDGDGGAEFWVRCAYVLAVCGTLLLVLAFGDFRAHVEIVEALRRVLILVFLGVFSTVAIISRNVWGGVRRALEDKPRAPVEAS